MFSPPILVISVQIVGIERQLSLKRVISKREGQKSLLPRAQETGAMGEEAIDRILKECGLRQSEVEVYVFLTKHGTLKSRDIAKQLRKDKAQVLRVLKTLQSRGIVEPTLETPQRFSPVPFEKVLDAFVKAKREEANLIETSKDELLLHWRQVGREKLEAPADKFTVIEGSHRVYFKVLTMIEETRKQFLAVCPIQELLKANNFGILDAVAKHPLKTTIQFRFLTESLSQPTGSTRTIIEEVQRRGVILRERNPDLGRSLSPRMVIRDEDEILLFFAPRTDSGFENAFETCLWTNCKDLIRSFAAVFDVLWNQSVEFSERTANTWLGEKPSTYSIFPSEIAQKKYEETLRSAQKEIIMLTTSNGLTDLWRNLKKLEDCTKKGLVLKIMAPITGKNFSVAKQIAEVCPVRHVPEGHMRLTLVDGNHLFRFAQDFTYLVQDLDYINKLKIAIDETWRNAQPPSSVTIETIINPPIPALDLSEHETPHREFLKLDIKFREFSVGTITERDVIGKIINAKRVTAKDPLRDINTAYGSNAIAIIHPPAFLNLPDMMINVWHCDKQSSFGAEDWLTVSLWLNTPQGYRYVPVAHVTDNQDAAEYRKGVYALAPAGQNTQLINKDQFQVRVQGNTLFAGWTVPIKLYQDYVLPPSCILFEGYGRVITGITKTKAASGRTQVQEFNRLEAFVTYFHPTSKYSAPGTDGLFNREIVFTAYPASSE